jgi:hypothetical protein
MTTVNIKALFALALLTAFATKLLGAEQSNGLWTSTSDWFHPVPNARTFWSRDAGDIQFPSELSIAVPSRYRAQAVKMLTTSEIIPLSNAQCQALGCPADAAPLLEKKITEQKKHVEFLEQHQELPRDAVQSLGEKQVREVRRHSLELIADEKKEIVQWENWKNKLKPFLARAVALNEGTGGFAAVVRGDTLVISHMCLGKHAVPMKNVPVIIFLQKKPQRIYHSLGMAE